MLGYVTGANIPLLALALGIWLVGYAVRTLRWGVFLEPLGKPSFKTAGSALMIGFAANNVLPLRAGEFIRALVLNKSAKKIPLSSGFASVVGERVFDGLAVVAITMVGATSLVLPDWARQAIYASTALFVGVFVLIWWMIRVENQRKRLFLAAQKRIQSKFLHRLFNLVDTLLAGVGVVSSPKKVVWVFGLSLLVWSIEAYFYYLSALSFSIEISFLNACFLMGILNLAIMIPAAPGGIGTFEFVTVESLKVLLVPQSLALGYGVVSHVLQNGSVILIGGVLGLKAGISYKDIEDQPHENDNALYNTK
jgi:uncharacterized protein (TIRG00374 family)